MSPFTFVCAYIFLVQYSLNYPDNLLLNVIPTTDYSDNLIQVVEIFIQSEQIYVILSLCSCTLKPDLHIRTY